jgi:hypothetical protein
MLKTKISQEIKLAVISEFINWLRKNGYHICKRWDATQKVTVYSPQVTYKNDEDVFFCKLFTGELKTDKYGHLISPKENNNVT